MTQKTTNYNLEKYDATDAPNLQGQYNRSMDILDTTLKTQSDRIDAIPTPEALPEGLKAFTNALGLSASNAGFRPPAADSTPSKTSPTRRSLPKACRSYPPPLPESDVLWQITRKQPPLTRPRMT